MINCSIQFCKMNSIEQFFVLQYKKITYILKIKGELSIGETCGFEIVGTGIRENKVRIEEIEL